MKQFISIIIPNYNGGRTIGTCLESIFATNDGDREVIVVDDGSEDNSRDVIRKYPCKLIPLEKRLGASNARNAGAAASTGEILFFTDADCVLQRDTLAVIRRGLAAHAPTAVIGGTYTPVPYDPGFFSRFQSAFINYSETKNIANPDYLATHALVIRSEIFRKVGGFDEHFLPILEDVEFSHRLRRTGYRLLMDPVLQVRHIFNFSLLRSMGNAARKSRYWIVYSLTNKDLFADSGTASREIKINGVTWFVTILLALLSLVSEQWGLLVPLPVLWILGIFANRHLLEAFYRAGGVWFASLAGTYYALVYPAAVWTGFFRGVIQFATRHAVQPDRNDPHRQDAG